MTTNSVDGQPAAATAPQGYSLPLSPSGTSAMLTPPPWHFAGNIVMVEYRVPPAAARAFLPPELGLGADPGSAAAVFAEWQWCSVSGEELSQPSRCQFGEFLILLGCEFAGKPMARCPYAWVDSAVPLVRGWLQGMPKQLGAIHQSRLVPVGRAGARLDRGERFHGEISVHGQKIAEASVQLTGMVTEPPPLHAVPLVHSRVLPPWLAGERPKSQLISSEVADVEFSEIWTGEADLKFTGELEKSLSDLGRLVPVEVGQGYVFSYAETLCAGQLLA
ncbi:enduracididine biosynthesis enzyme MppR [Amycolatopsis sp.]|uniref:enduracididine biosynthesis enzyme MppR n=1 Tax=Amycolatopsis sp. TaxID=37632 RepID=UPI002D807FDD|nr:enduracididine biosynthesis enzyme MppR [Amycolatopsis sp.]HET6703373.1 enduracididine biosynthesis enzyme MppR [Amycolatopsis sp.]